MIAILGASGTIGRSLARTLAAQLRPIVLFARQAARLAEEPWPRPVVVQSLDQFSAEQFDLVINAIGVGDPQRVAATGADILEVTRTWDQRVLDTMGPNTRYVFLSSGIVHPFNSAPPAPANGRNAPPAGDLSGLPPYTIAKLRAEARHREARERAILDVRIFGYADISLSMSGTFFLSDLFRSVIRRERLITSPHDMVRDYAGARGITGLIDCWQAHGAPNLALDLYSKAPVAKHELLRIVQDRYGLQVETRGNVGDNPTGQKPVYASQSKVAATFGYSPRRTAAEVVIDVLDDLLEMHGGDRKHATSRLS